jgi:hypothetical protein
MLTAHFHVGMRLTMCGSIPSLPLHTFMAWTRTTLPLTFLPHNTTVIESRQIRQLGHVACLWKNRNVYKVLLQGPDGNRPLGRPRNKGDNNIKVAVKGTGWVGMDWINLVQDKEKTKALVNVVMNLQVP